jgi:lipase chaperone LimK
VPRSRLLAALCALALVALLALLRARSSSPDEPASAPVPARAPGPPEKAAAQPPRAAAPRPAEPPADLPPSLAGTEIDGALDVGPDGHLVIGPRVLALFDYFLSATGEETDATLRARIEAHARAQLEDPALGEALDLLDRYMAYREAGRTLSIPNNAPAADRLEAVRRLRRTHFGDAAAALFGEDERAAEVAIAKSQIVQDPALSPDDRDARLAAADSRLPEASRAAHTHATSVLDLRADEAALRADGADEAAISRYRASQLGPEAAARLDALDRERAAFKARIEAFRKARDLQCSKLTDPAACEAALLESSFDARERIRVRAILQTPAP